MPPQYTRLMPLRGDIATRFWSKVDRSGECWLWTGYRRKDGYGVFWVRDRRILAHRMAVELTSGLVLPEAVVCHHCDTPACVRPDHLFVGTHSDNHADMVNKGRQARGARSGPRQHPERMRRGDQHGLRLHPESVERGEDRYNAVLTDEAVRIIRREYSFRRVTQAQLAARFGVKREAIGKIVRRERWKHVE